MASICALCGNNPATTRDHIPPQGIYPKPRDNDINLNTVPACSQCNNGSSIEDEEFKVLMGLSTGEFHEEPQKVIDWLASTVGNNQRIANQIFSTKQSVYANLRGEIFEPAIAIKFNIEKYNKVISKIIRGLYWMQKDSPLGDTPKIKVFPGNLIEPEFARKVMGLMDCLEAHSLNKETFVYKVQFLEDGASFWGMQFFKKHTVFAYAEAP